MPQITRAEVELIADHAIQSAIREAQLKMGIKTGDTAGLYFDGDPTNALELQNIQQSIVVMLLNYLQFEVDVAAHDNEEAPM